MAGVTLYWTYSRAEGFHYRPIERMTGMKFLKPNGGTSNSADTSVLVYDPTTRRNVEKRYFPNTVYVPPVVVTPTNRSRLPADIVWTDRTTSLTITNATLTGGTYGTPDVNGRYTLPAMNLRSTVPGVPAMVISATLPVRIKDSNFWGWGMDAYMQTGMVYCGYNSDVRVENSLGLSGKPPAGYNGAMPGFFVVSESGANFEMENCEWHKTRGVNIPTFRAPSASGRTGGGVRIKKCAAYDIDGRRVNAAGAWSGATLIANFVQFQNCANLTSDSYVEDYIVRNDPVYGGQPEDFVSTYNSYCAPGQNVIFRRFLAENNLPYDAAWTNSGGTLATIGNNGGAGTIGYGGTCGLAGDNQGITVTAANVGQGFTIRDGTMLTFANYGGAIQAGHNNLIDNVKAISQGFIRSAATQGYSRMAWTGGGGFHAWERSVNTGNPVIWFGNIIRNCTASYNLMNTSGVIARGSTPFWDNSNGGCTFTNNTIPAVPANVAAALAELDAARTAQYNVWKNAGTVIGLTDASSVFDIKISTDPA